MRMIGIIAAMLTALGMAPQPAEAGERGIGFRHFSPHAGAKFARPHHGAKFHHRGIFAKQRHLSPHAGARFARPHHGARFDHRRIFAKQRHFKSRHLRDFDPDGLVLKFGDGGFALKFGHIPHFTPDRFEHRHGHRRPFFGFDRPGSFKPWDHGFTSREDRHGGPEHLKRFGHHLPRSPEGRTRGRRGAASEAAILEQLEELGFRHVPKLLRDGHHRPSG